MCGFAGLFNKEKNINHRKFRISVDKLSHRGPDEEGYFVTDYFIGGHKRLVIVDKENGMQPMKYEDYVILYNGELYNTEELRDELINKGYTFYGYSDTEVLLKLYHCYKDKCLDKLNGIYSFIIFDNDNLFASRDRVGVKPLYYYYNDNEIFVSSEIKSIISYYSVNKVTIEGLKDLLSIGPSKRSGYTPYKDIYELKPGHYLYFNGNLIINKYWDLVTINNNLSFEETLDKTRYLVKDSIKRQLVSDVNIATFLSGGLDSSIITAITAKEKDLDTFSLDYQDNDNTFKSNKYQVSRDKDYIKYMVDEYNLNHKEIIIPTKDLESSLKQAVIARDMPGMSDIDSSLYLFSKEIKKDHTVCLSGECADEIFGGYPWYNKKLTTNYPWLQYIEDRENLLNNKYKKLLNIKDHSINLYNTQLSECDSNDEHKKMFYINVKTFMTTLLDRKDRMTSHASLEVRVPFADHRIIELMYNTPHDYKYYRNTEKALLRDAFSDILPEEITNRKKNPYPKTYSEEYTKSVCNLLKEAISDTTSILHEIFNIEVLEELIKSKGSTYKNPWFGQLMTGPQLIAYLYQFHYWFKEYNLELCKE